MNIIDSWTQASTALPIRLVSTAHIVSIADVVTDQMGLLEMFELLSFISLSSFAPIELFLCTRRFSNMESANIIIKLGALSVPHNGLNPPISI